MPRIVVLRCKRGAVKNEIETEPLSDDLFLEFGRRVGENYEYIALMRGKASTITLDGKEYRSLAAFVSGKRRKGVK